MAKGYTERGWLCKLGWHHWSAAWRTGGLYHRKCHRCGRQQFRATRDSDWIQR